jgi:hypothetical protein
MRRSAVIWPPTSVGSGKGADLGGLEGAEARCAALAAGVGNTRKNWRAYLSTMTPGGDAGVNARDLIGKGPWQNVKGVIIAKDVDDLHSSNTNLNKETALTEKGEIVPGRADPVNTHDLLTGSDPQGMYSTAGGDTTCGNWTKSSDDGSAIVGYHDHGPQGQPPHGVLELFAWHPGLQPGRAEEHRLRRAILLLRRELSKAVFDGSRPGPAGASKRRT